MVVEACGGEGSAVPRLRNCMVTPSGVLPGLWRYRSQDCTSAPRVAATHGSTTDWKAGCWTWKVLVVEVVVKPVPLTVSTTVSLPACDQVWVTVLPVPVVPSPKVQAKLAAALVSAPVSVTAWPVDAGQNQNPPVLVQLPALSVKSELSGGFVDFATVKV